MIISLSIYLAGRWNPVAIDYAVFWKAVRRADPYQLDAYFVNPPPALLALQPLRLVGFVPGYVLWTALSLLLFFFAARRLVGDRAALLSLFSAASIHGLLLGQAPMMLGAAILFAVPRRRFGAASSWDVWRRSSRSCCWPHLSSCWPARTGSLLAA